MTTAELIREEERRVRVRERALAKARRTRERNSAKRARAVERQLAAIRAWSAREARAFAEYQRSPTPERRRAWALDASTR